MNRPAGSDRIREPTMALRSGLGVAVAATRWVLLAGFLVGGVTFVALEQVPPTYSASSWLLAPRTGPGNAELGLITPPNVDPGIYRAAVLEGPVAAAALTSITGRPPTAEALRSFKRHIRITVEHQRISSVIRVSASGQDPAAAKRAADALATGLLNWDDQRARTTVANSVRALQQTIGRIDADLAAGTRNGQALSEPERASLVALRSARERELGTARTRSTSSVVVGLLEPLAAASLPDRPSAPNVALGTLLASIAGMVLGFGLFGFRWYLGPRDWQRGQLVELAGVPLLAEFRTPARAMGPNWREAVSLLRSRVLFAAGKEGTYVLGVTAPSSGAAKAKISVAVAASLVRAGYRTLLVDTDLRRPNLTEALGSSGNETAPFIAQLERPRLDYSPAIATLEGERTCDFVPGIRAQAHAAGLLERALQTRLGLWKRRYDYIVLDCPPVLPFADALAVARQCSGVVVCVPSTTSTPSEITRTTHLLRTHSANVLGTVLLGADADAGSRDAAPRFGGPRRRRSRTSVRNRTRLGDR